MIILASFAKSISYFSNIYLSTRLQQSKKDHRHAKHADVITIKTNKCNYCQRRCVYQRIVIFFYDHCSLRRVIFSSCRTLLKVILILQIKSKTYRYYTPHYIQIIYKNMDDHLSIYQQLLRPTAGFLDQLMGEGGEAMLDKEILKMRDEIGEDEFNEYAQEFFKDTKIDYRTFFGQAQHESKVLQSANKQKQEVHVEEEIKEQAETERKEEETGEILQPVPAEHEQYTNNSQQIENQYEEIERQDLGNKKYRIKYKNGDMYEGEMEEGMKSGWGDYHYQSGEKYSGCFIDDQINGYGRYYFLSGADYEGDWSSGMKHGIGILKFANKDTYEGSFSNDDLHGKGIYRYHNGDVFDGNFRKGKRQGNGVFEGADGRYQKGQWVDDKFQV